MEKTLDQVYAEYYSDTENVELVLNEDVIVIEDDKYFQKLTNANETQEAKQTEFAH